MTTINMNDSCVSSIEQIKEFLKLDSSYQFKVASKQDKYAWIEEVLRKFNYHGFKQKKQRTIVRRYIKRVTGISKAQLTRLIKKHNQNGKLIPDYSALKKNGFATVYGPAEIALLIKTDVAHRRLSGEATQIILKREYETFGKTEYEAMAGISVPHIYYLRANNRQYNSSEARFFAQTQAVQVSIGIRRKPEPNGQPGYLRVDSVHQGDLNKAKGVYHINLVDEVTQWEMIATVPQITERYLKPIVEALLDLFPFKIYEFHSDNGSEFINHIIAKLLVKLYIELTKSRSRHSNDNALVESKNGAIIRKFYGRNYIPKRYAPLIEKFNQKYINLYLNYHRPCGFAENYVDKRGKVKKKYKHWIIPYEKLKSLENAQQYLKSGITFEQLNKIAYAKSDNEFAEGMMKAKEELFKKIRRS